MKKVSLKVNGRNYQFVVAPGRVLLDLLREDLHLVGAKQSCDRQGPVRCLYRDRQQEGRAILPHQSGRDLEGAEVITVEGLGTPDNPHLIQGGFRAGGCGPVRILHTGQ